MAENNLYVSISAKDARRLVEQFDEEVRKAHGRYVPVAEELPCPKMHGNTRVPGAVWVGDEKPTEQQLQDAVDKHGVFLEHQGSRLETNGERLGRIAKEHDKLASRVVDLELWAERVRKS